MQALIVRCSLGNPEFVWAACVLPAILLCPCVQRGSHHGAGVALAVPFSSFFLFCVRLILANTINRKRSEVMVMALAYHARSPSLRKK